MSNTIEFKGKSWVVEVNSDKMLFGFGYKKTLFSEVSPFQKVEVVESVDHGRILLNDDLVMLSERDEFVYHEMMAHIPLYVHPCAKRVLIIGGGDGGTAREVLRHSYVEKCVMVEIDKAVVEACQQFIPQTASQLKDPRLELIIEDAVQYVARTDEKFDVILVDSTDPIGPAQPLFGEEFYDNIYKCLTEEGIVVSQGESPWYNSDMQKTLLTILHQRFTISSIYNFHNLTYPGGLWSFTLGSKKFHPLKDFQLARYEDEKMSFEYYHSGIHRGCFEIPQFQKNNLQSWIRF